MGGFHTTLLSDFERVKSKQGRFPTVHACLAPLTELPCLPEGSFHSLHVPEAAEVSLAICARRAMPHAGPCPSPAVLPASQIHGNVGVHTVTPQHC